MIITVLIFALIIYTITKGKKRTSRKHKSISFLLNYLSPYMKEEDKENVIAELAKKEKKEVADFKKQMDVDLSDMTLDKAITLFNQSMDIPDRTFIFDTLFNSCFSSGPNDKLWDILIKLRTETVETNKDISVSKFATKNSIYQSQTVEAEMLRNYYSVMNLNFGASKEEIIKSHNHLIIAYKRQNLNKAVNGEILDPFKIEEAFTYLMEKNPFVINNETPANPLI